MQDKKLQSHETDITGVLVIALVLMIGILIVKVTGDFTKKSTSTSTRAAMKKGLNNKYKAYCQKQLTDTLTDAKYASLTQYVSAYTYQLSCGSLNYKIFNPGGVLTSGSALSTDSTSEPGICCIPLSVMFVANDTTCTNQMPSGHWPDGTTVEHIPAVCKDKSDCTGDYGTINTDQYTIQTNNTCDNVSNKLVNPFSKGINRCCMMPLETD